VSTETRDPRAGTREWAGRGTRLPRLIRALTCVGLLIGAGASQAAGPAVTPPSPNAQSVPVGATVTFTVNATGPGPFTYFWQFAVDGGTFGTLSSGGRISGANTATLQITSVQTSDAGRYRCLVGNAGGQSNSGPGTLAVSVPAPPTVTPPASQSVPAGANASFSVTASGQGPFNYFWQYSNGGTFVSLSNGGRISGANAPTLLIANAQPSDAGNYRCLVSNVGGQSNSGPASLTVNVSPPTITQPPANQSVVAGGTAGFSVGATGFGPLSYYWQFSSNGGTFVTLSNGGRISGANAPALQITGVQAGDAGRYRCLVSNSAGQVNSGPATLTVITPPSVTQPPVSQSAVVGAGVAFSVGATGDVPLSYQWQLSVNGGPFAPLGNGGRISGATTAALQIANVQVSDSGQYRCLVSNAGGTTASAAATLSVNVAPPTVTQPPSNQTVMAGGNASFSVGVTGAGPFNYFWQFSNNGGTFVTLSNGGRIAGANTPTLQITNVQTADAGRYRCLVSNAGGQVNSGPATLTVTLPPAPTVTAPASQTVAPGVNVSFSVTASGQGPLSYFWQFSNGGTFVTLSNGGRISGANTPTLQIASVQASDAGQYRCLVGNAGGQTNSGPATLTVLAPPTITTQPTSQTVVTGGTAGFTVAAAGGSLTYQWQFSANGSTFSNLANGGRVSGATTASLQVANVQASDAGHYRCLVSNPAGQAVSAIASLTVAPRPPALVVTAGGTALPSSGGTIAWGQVAQNSGPGQLATKAVAVSNGAPAGSSNLVLAHSPANVEVVNTQGTAFSLQGVLASPLAPGQGDDFGVRLSTAQPGTYAGVLKIWHNDPQRPNPLQVALTGTVNPLPPKPTITSIVPDQIPQGAQTAVTVTGTNLAGAAVTVGTNSEDPGTVRAFPTVQVLSVSPGGTQMQVLIDARDPEVLHYYGLYVSRAQQADGALFRVVPEGPVIDYWTPSEVSAGSIFALNLVGVNLQGAEVIAEDGSVRVLDVDNSDDDFLSGFLEMDPGSAGGSTNLRIRGLRGQDAIIPIDLRANLSEVQRKTTAMTAASTGEPVFYIQQVAARDGMFGRPPRPDTASLSSWDVCLSWGRSRSFGRMWTRTWFKDPLTGRWGPLADQVLRRLRIGQTSLLQTQTFAAWFFIDLSLNFRVCFSDDVPFDFDVSACIVGSAGISIPIVGGVSIEFEACFGSPSWYEVDITGTGFLRRIQFHRRGSTGAEPLECVRITDQDPTSGSGQRTFTVEAPECCEEDVGVGWEGNFYIADFEVASQSAGRASPQGPFCPLCQVPPFVPGYWNDLGQIQRNNNCYNYAANTRTDSFAQPGRASGQSCPIPCGTCCNLDTIAQYTAHDGLIPSDRHSPCPSGMAKVFLVIWPSMDFHYFRRDSFGQWSEKRGGTEAKDLDESGLPIGDPEAADIRPYQLPGRYFCTCSALEQGRGHAFIR
jgi:hypothetical protein